MRSRWLVNEEEGFASQSRHGSLRGFCLSAFGFFLLQISVFLQGNAVILHLFFMISSGD